MVTPLPVVVTLSFLLSATAPLAFVFSFAFSLPVRLVLMVASAPQLTLMPMLLNCCSTCSNRWRKRFSLSKDSLSCTISCFSLSEYSSSSSSSSELTQSCWNSSSSGSELTWPMSAVSRTEPSL